MARVSGPFLSVSARGSVGKTLTASTWKGVAYIKEWFKPGNPKTEEQMKHRNRLASAVADYQQLTAQNKLLWDQSASGQQISGFNLYVRRYINYMIENDEQKPTAPFLP